MDTVSGTSILLLAIGVFFYFIPNWVAMARKHHNSDAIFITNLLLGWTALGWIAALIWAFTEVKPKLTEQAQQAQKPARQLPSAQSNTSRYEDLAKAKELRDDGILTEEEFQAEKKRILSGVSSAIKTGVSVSPSPSARPDTDELVAELERLGYRTKPKSGGGWKIREPLGGVVTCNSADELAEYAQEKMSQRD